MAASNPLVSRPWREVESASLKAVSARDRREGAAEEAPSEGHWTLIHP